VPLNCELAVYFRNWAFRLGCFHDLRGNVNTARIILSFRG